MDFVKKTKSERSLESLVAENKELLERVEKLEAQVSTIMDFHKRELEMRISKWAYPDTGLKRGLNTAFFNNTFCTTMPVFNPYDEYGMPSSRRCNAE